MNPTASNQNAKLDRIGIQRVPMETNSSGIGKKSRHAVSTGRHSEASAPTHSDHAVGDHLHLLSWRAGAETTLEKAVRVLDASPKAALQKALGRSASRRRANDVVASLTGIADFFASNADGQAFREPMPPDR